MIDTRKKAIITMIITALLWSLGGVLIKLVTGNPLAIASLRSGIGAIFIFIYTKFKFSKINKKILIGTLCYSFTSIGFVFATKLTTSANAIFLEFTAPVWVVLFSFIFLKTKIRLSDIISIFIIICGMCIFFTVKIEKGMLIGNILAILTGISFAGFIVNLKTYKTEDTICPIIYGNMFNFIIGLPFYSLSLFAPKSIISLIILGCFQIGLSYILYSKAIKHLSAIDGIIIPILEPLLNPVWVFIVLGEEMSRNTILGGIIIILTIIARDIYQRKRAEY